MSREFEHVQKICAIQSASQNSRRTITKVVAGVSKPSQTLLNLVYVHIRRREKFETTSSTICD